MAWERAESGKIGGSSIYAYTEIDWSVHGDKCTYTQIGGVYSPVGGWDNSPSGTLWYREKVSGTWTAWVQYGGAAHSEHYSGPGDMELKRVERQEWYRASADREVEMACDVYATTSTGSGTGTAKLGYTVPHLAPSVTWAASNPVVRNSDNSITLTWDAPALEYSAMCLEVSTDGGSWSQFAVLWNTATSYTWTGCSADHSYQFRIRSNYLASYSDYDVCDTVIVNTPLPPDKLTTQATSGTNVTVTLVNTSPVATSCEYRLGDGTNWGAVVTGQDTQSFSVDMGSDHYLQVRNANATGTSNWRQSSYINTVTKPNKPTLWEPVGGAIVEPGDITFSWNYNSADGSEQTAWELEYTLPMLPTPTTVSSTASTATDKQTTITMNEGWEPYWRVRTKGASSSWSDWSSGRTLRVYSAPTVSIAAITATGMPISISATYSDTHQPYPMGDPVTFDCVYAAVTLKSGDRTILTKHATITTGDDGTSLSCDISLSDALLDNGAEYTVVLDVRSSSGLSESANATFTTAFTEPQAGELSITNDPETGYVNLTATFEQPEAIPLSWELGVLGIADGSEVASTTRARTVGVSSVQTDSIYVITGTGKVNVHSYSNGTWKKALSDWASLPYYYHTDAYNGLRIMMKNANDSEVDISAIDIKCASAVLPSDVVYSGATNAQFDTAEGYVKSLTVDGKSKKFNQLGDSIVASSSFSSSTYDATTDTTTGISSGSGNNPYMLFYLNQSRIIDGHIFLFDGYVSSDLAGVSVDVNNYRITTSTINSNAVSVETAGKYYYKYTIFTAGSTGDTQSAAIRFRYRYNSAVTASGTKCMIRSPLLIDLTNIFGAGNEPTTIDDARLQEVRRYALAHKAFDGGSLINIENVQTVGKNLVLELYQGSIMQGEGYAQLFSAAGGTVAVAKIEQNTDYTISAKTYTGANRRRLYLVEIDPRGNACISDYKAVESASVFDTDWTFTFNSRTYNWVMFGMSTSSVAYNPDAVVQIEKGTTATAYEPPSITTITATLRSAGDTADELQVDKTSVKVSRNVTVHVFDGTENWGSNTTDTGHKAWYLTATQGYPESMFANRERYAAGYATDTGLWKNLGNKCVGVPAANTTGKAGILFTDDDYADVTAWKANLAANPLTVIWAALDTTEETLSDISLIELGTAATVETDLDSTFSMVGWDGSADAVSISVARVNADGITPLIEDAQSGAGAVDKYAPLNTTYQYAVTTKSSANAVKTVYVDNEIVTDLWFAYWGDNIASAKWNPDNGGIQIARPQKTRVYYAGRKDPVSYDGSAVALSETPSWMLVDRSEVQPFVQLIEDGGRGVYKSCDGWVYHADFDLTLSPKYTAIGYYGGIMLSVTRIAGDQL